MVILALLVLVVPVAVLSFFTVEQQHAAVIERFGKFIRIAYPGLNMRIPFVEAISGRVSLKIMQLDVEVETKTLDDVFIKIVTSVQYKVLNNKIYPLPQRH